MLRHIHCKLALKIFIMMAISTDTLEAHLFCNGRVLLTLQVTLKPPAEIKLE